MSNFILILYEKKKHRPQTFIPHKSKKKPKARGSSNLKITATILKLSSCCRCIARILLLSTRNITRCNHNLVKYRICVWNNTMLIIMNSNGVLASTQKYQPYFHWINIPNASCLSEYASFLKSSSFKMFYISIYLYLLSAPPLPHCQTNYTLGLGFLELPLLSRLALKKYKSVIDFVFRLDMGVRLKKCRFSLWHRMSI